MPWGGGLGTAGDPQIWGPLTEQTSKIGRQLHHPPVVRSEIQVWKHPDACAPLRLKLKLENNITAAGAVDRELLFI
jgi:hypothetical protein